MNSLFAWSALLLLSACGEGFTAGTPGQDAGSLPIGVDSGNDGTVRSDCDASKSVKSDGCVLEEANAVFVDGAKGLDTNAGTKASPKKTIGAALTAAKSGNKAHVIACGDAAYVEHIVIDAPVGLHGGFACADWAYTGSKASVKPADAGYAIEVKAVSGAVVIEDIAAESVAGTKPAESSITAFIANSADVKLSRVTLKAGRGMSAGTATFTSNYAGAIGPGGNPPDLVRSKGGAGGAIACANGTTSAGGAGGDPLLQGNGGKGTATPMVGTGTDGIGGTALANNCPYGAFVGANAAAVNEAAMSASAWGTLTTKGWYAAGGTDGKTGNPGQGGGGGGGARTNGGSGGGAGGCGGSGGGGGRAGGSSFSIIVFRSNVKFDSSQLQAEAAGIGANGADGQDGQPGGFGASSGCQGAEGGGGAGGGGGGGGAGGLSVAIGYVGSSPVWDRSTTFALGKPGLGGSAGKGGLGGRTSLNGEGAPKGPDATGAGKAGEAAATKELL